MEFSADYPGYWQRAVEEANGGMAVFLAGGVGSHGPKPGGSDFEGAEKMGTALARSTAERLEKCALTNVISFGVIGLEVTLPPLNTRLTDGIRLRPWIAKKLLPPTTGRSFVQAFRIGDAIWLSTPCDFSGEMAVGVKEHFRARNFAAVVTSFNGDYIGYVIPPRYYHLDGYEPRTMSFYGPNVPDYLDELIRGVGDMLTRN
jgi:neutral ceramidase